VAIVLLRCRLRVGNDAPLQMAYEMIGSRRATAGWRRHLLMVLLVVFAEVSGDGASWSRGLCA